MRHASLYFGDAKVFNLHVAEYCNIYGYHRIYFSNKTYVKYNAPQPLPIFFSTGTLFFCPSFNDQGVKTDDIARIIFEAFLKRNAFDRNDIEHIDGRIFTSNNDVRQLDKFVALYDASSLNITRSLTSIAILKDLFGFIHDHKNVIIRNICPAINPETNNALSKLCDSILENEGQTVIGTEEELKTLRFKTQTMVKYRMPDENDPESTTEIDAQILGDSSDGCGYTIFANGKIIFDVIPDDIVAIETTEFV